MLPHVPTRSAVNLEHAGRTLASPYQSPHTMDPEHSNWKPRRTVLTSHPSACSTEDGTTPTRGGKRCSSAQHPAIVTVSTYSALLSPCHCSSRLRPLALLRRA